MKQALLFLTLTLSVLASRAGTLQFIGNELEPYVETPAASTGLSAVYILYDSDEVGLQYTATSDATVTWYIFGESGGAYAEEINGITRNGRTTTMAQVRPNHGYIIEEGTNRTYFWVVNYSNYYLHINSVDLPEEPSCNSVKLTLEGSGDNIYYYTINGKQTLLNREIVVTYNTATWDSTQWVTTEVTETFASFSTPLTIAAPLVNTTFTLSGDRFLKFWDKEIVITTDTYTTISVDQKTTAVQEQRNNDNEKSSTTGEFGGSAPVTITFTGYPTEGVTYRVWQMSSDSEFESIVLSYYQDEIEWTGEEAGTWYWRYYVANSDGSCESYGDVYTVTIGESELTCPNVFSPGTTEGINDVWKVSYKSIIEFHCWIFNRWGVQICELTSPEQGWDGTYNGKLVKPGVYYYVLQAKGSDGVVYKKSGDINIIRYKQNPNYIGGSSTE